MKIANIIQGPHVLYTGANGRPTLGITVEAVAPREGFQTVWSITDSTIGRATVNELSVAFGITSPAANHLKATISS